MQEKCRVDERQLKEEGVYEITEGMRGQLGDFVGGFQTEEERRKKTIKNTYEKTGYVMDTHDGGSGLCLMRNNRKESGDERSVFVASTCESANLSIAL